MIIAHAESVGTSVSPGPGPGPGTPHTDASLSGGKENVIEVRMQLALAEHNTIGFLNDESLTPQQIRFVEMVIDQLTARGVMEASALYEPPFSNLHAEGPDALGGL